MTLPTDWCKKWDLDSASVTGEIVTPASTFELTGSGSTITFTDGTVWNGTTFNGSTSLSEGNKRHDNKVAFSIEIKTKKDGKQCLKFEAQESKEGKGVKGEDTGAGSWTANEH